jgi:hypothetical protein
MGQKMAIVKICLETNLMTIKLFDYKLSKLTEKRDVAMSAGATAVALRLTYEILELINNEKTLRKLVYNV